MVEAITGDAIKQISALTGDRVIITNVSDPYDSTRALVGFTVEPGGGAKQFDVAAVIEKFGTAAHHRHGAGILAHVVHRPR